MFKSNVILDTSIFLHKQSMQCRSDCQVTEQIGGEIILFLVQVMKDCYLQLKAFEKNGDDEEEEFESGE